MIFGGNDEKVEELEEEIEELKQEKQRLEKRFKAEKQRRSKLSTEKQEAEKKLKKLKQKQEETEEEEVEEESGEFRDASVEEVLNILEKLGSVESPKNDLLTVYSPGSFRELSDMKALKNSVDRQGFEFLKGEGFAAFIDPDMFMLKIKSRVLEKEWEISDSFDVDSLSDFIQKQKTWAVVSAGDSRIVEEENGEIQEVEEIGSRVDKKQKKGGFSQGRFERKRDEQVEEHVEMVEQKMPEDALLVGEGRLCKKLPGNYLGGVDRSRELVEALYGFKILHGQV
jgi:hypothetical protein